MQLLKDLMLLCLQKQIWIQTEHIPGVKNTQADMMSQQKSQLCTALYPELRLDATSISPVVWPQCWKHSDFLPIKC